MRVTAKQKLSIHNQPAKNCAWEGDGIKMNKLCCSFAFTVASEHHYLVTDKIPAVPTGRSCIGKLEKKEKKSPQ